MVLHMVLPNCSTYPRVLLLHLGLDLVGQAVHVHRLLGAFRLAVACGQWEVGSEEVI